MIVTCEFETEFDSDVTTVSWFYENNLLNMTSALATNDHIFEGKLMYSYTAQSYAMNRTYYRFGIDTASNHTLSTATI